MDDGPPIPIQQAREPAEYVPITAAQRAYADEFVAWFRADDLERGLRDVRLRHLFARVAAEARRAA